MCVIAICMDKKPSWETVRECDLENPHGMGIAYFKNKEAHYKKGILDPKKFFELIQETPTPFALHFRKTSIGGHSKLLCHPFEVTKESKLRTEGSSKILLMHNGTIPYWEQLLLATRIPYNNKEDMSDSRAVAMVASNIIDFEKDNYGLLWKLGSKFLVIDSVREKMWMYGDYIKEDGILYSNLKWKNYTSYQSHFNGYFGHGYTFKKENEQKNPGCTEYRVITRDGVTTYEPVKYEPIKKIEDKPAEIKEVKIQNNTNEDPDWIAWWSSLSKREKKAYRKMAREQRDKEKKTALLEYKTSPVPSQTQPPSFNDKPSINDVDNCGFMC